MKEKVQMFIKLWYKSEDNNFSTPAVKNNRIPRSQDLSYATSNMLDIALSHDIKLVLYQFFAFFYIKVQVHSLRIQTKHLK